MLDDDRLYKENDQWLMINRKYLPKLFVVMILITFGALIYSILNMPKALRNGIIPTIEDLRGEFSKIRYENEQAIDELRRSIMPSAFKGRK